MKETTKTALRAAAVLGVAFGLCVTGLLAADAKPNPIKEAMGKYNKAPKGTDPVCKKAGDGQATKEEIKGEKKNRLDDMRVEKKEKKEVEDSYSDDDDDDDGEEDDGDYYDFDDYVGYRQDIRLKSKRRKNRRRAACNKKRRMKKKIKYVEAESQETREEVEYERIVEVEGEGEGNMRRRVSFNMDSAHEGQVKVPDPAQPHRGEAAGVDARPGFSRPVHRARAPVSPRLPRPDG